MNIRTFIQFVILAAVLICLSPAAGHAESRVDIGATFGEEGLKGFFFSVSDYYRVPEREVVIVRDRGIPYYEMPVVFYVASLAHVAPPVIIDLRLSGRSWMDITLHYGLSPEIYYVPVSVAPGPPYGRAYGFFNKRPRKEWRKIALPDDDIINLVNLKFTSEYYGYRPDDVIRLRSAGKDFVVIHDDIRKEKRGRGRGGRHEERHEDRGKGKGRGRR